MTKRKGRRRKSEMCSCGHERAMHDASGVCRYGHETATGGCTCVLETRSEKARAPEIAPTSTASDLAAATSALSQAFEALTRLRALLERLGRAELRTVEVRKVGTAPSPPIVLPKVASQPAGRERLKPAAARILSLLVRADPRDLSADYVAIYTGYSASSGGFAAALAQLRRLGYVTGNAQSLSPTPAGVTAAGPIAEGALPAGADLVQMWSERLPPCPTSILLCLHDAQPSSLSVAELANATRYSAGSGGFAAALATLRKLKLIESGPMGIRLHRSLTEDDEARDASAYERMKSGIGPNGERGIQKL